MHFWIATTLQWCSFEYSVVFKCWLAMRISNVTRKAIMLYREDDTLQRLQDIL